MPYVPTPPGPDSVEIAKFSGLKNTVDRERLKADELARGQNIDLDDVGEVRRRRGYTKKMSGVFHSLFTTNLEQTFAVRDGVLGLINPNYTFAAVQPGIGTDPVLSGVAYVQVGPTLYFSNRIASGRVDLTNFTVSPWGAQDDQGFWFSPVVNPSPTEPPVGGRLFGAPPLATALTYFNGRIYLASDRTLWATEMHLYNFVDKTKNHRLFESPITALGTVTDGIYVGTTQDVWFLGGDFHTHKRAWVLGVGAVPGTMVSAPAELVDPQVRLNPDQPIEVKSSVVFMTENGIVVGLDSGKTFNLTESRFLFPKAAAGAAMFRKQDGNNTYLSVLDSRGTAVSNVRFGDHLDAVLVRGSGAA